MHGFFYMVGGRLGQGTGQEKWVRVSSPATSDLRTGCATEKG